MPHKFPLSTRPHPSSRYAGLWRAWFLSVLAAFAVVGILAVMVGIALARGAVAVNQAGAAALVILAAWTALCALPWMVLLVVLAWWLARVLPRVPAALHPWQARARHLAQRTRGAGFAVARPVMEIYVTTAVLREAVRRLRAIF